MKLSSHAKAAFNNLFFAPMRTILAMCGIMIGTASVVALVSSGNLAAQKALELFKSLGTEQMALAFSPEGRGSDSGKQIKVETLLAMKQDIPEVNLVAPYLLDSVDASFRGISLNADVVAATPELEKVIKIHLKEGRFFSELDKNQNFCVLGSNIPGSLKNMSLLGKRIRLGKMMFTVIGIAHHWPENTFFSGDINTSIIIPIHLIKLISSSSQTISNTILELRQDANIDTVKKEINTYFSQNIPGFSVDIQSAQELIKSMNAQQDTFTMLLLFIGAISLLVGGIGVMNIMLASVSERRYEIGLRLAIGAQPKDIQLMFLMEAVMLATLGGLSGVLLGEICTYIVAVASGWTFAFFFLPAFIGFGFSVLISVFFGFYPAYLASQLNPIEALRAG